MAELPALTKRYTRCAQPLPKCPSGAGLKDTDRSANCIPAEAAALEASRDALTG